MNMKVLCLGITSTIVAIAGLGLCLPNLIWLRHSTLRISNQGETTVDTATVKVGDESLDYRAIEPGAFEFTLLPKKASGSLAVSLPPSHKLGTFCHSYVEQKMYHIDVVVKDGQVVDCQASLPILSSFWVFKALI